MIDPEKKAETTGAAKRGTAYSGQPDDLHDLLTSPEGLDAEDPLAQLRNDPNYSALIRDLEYIASQARLLFEPASEAPSDGLWAKIEKQLPTKQND